MTVPVNTHVKMPLNMWPSCKKVGGVVVRPLRTDHGWLTPATMLLLVGLIGFGALGVDLWSVISERRALQEAADSSARAGANGIDLEHFAFTGDVRLDRGDAERLAAENLADQPPEVTRSVVWPADYRATTDEVQVVIRGRVDFFLAHLFTDSGMDLEVRSVAEPRIEN